MLTGDGDETEGGDEGAEYEDFGEARPTSMGNSGGCSVAGASGGLALGFFGLVALGARRRE